MAKKVKLDVIPDTDTPEPKKRKGKKDEYEYPRFINGFPDSVRKLWRRAIEGNSRKTAIRAQCLICCGGSPSEVKNCTMPTCTLYKYRITG